MGATATKGPVVGLASSSGDYPLKGTTAQRMLSDALDRAQRDKQQSQRFISGQLGYKSSVVLSHMASGRVPIPVDRAIDFARYLGMDQNQFLLAVLEQRFPEVDFRRLLSSLKGKAPKVATSNSALADELEALAGKPLDELPIGIIKVLREAVQDDRAPRRWIAPHEMTIIEQIRRYAPDGLTPAQNSALAECLQNL
jgi:hypothetical protein